MTSTKEKILIAASSLFRKQGYHATTLNQISNESMTPRGSVYYYFPDGKEQLAKEAILRTGKVIQERIEHALSRDESLSELFYLHINRMADEIKEQSQSDTLNIFSLIAISREVSESSTILRDTCRDVYDSWTNCFYTKLKASNYEHEEAKKLALIIHVLIEGAYAYVVSHQDPEAMYIVSQQVRELLRKK